MENSDKKLSFTKPIFAYFLPGFVYETGFFIIGENGCILWNCHLVKKSGQKPGFVNETGQNGYLKNGQKGPKKGYFGVFLAVFEVGFVNETHFGQKPTFFLYLDVGEKNVKESLHFKNRCKGKFTFF